MSPLSRRRVLQAGSVGFSLGAGGCMGFDPAGCPEHHEVVIRTKPATENPESPIHFDGLPADQQPFLRAAANEGEYRACPFSEMENRKAPSELSRRVGENASERDGNTAYLEYQDEYYAISLRIGDQVYSWF